MSEFAGSAIERASSSLQGTARFADDAAPPPAAEENAGPRAAHLDAVIPDPEETTGQIAGHDAEANGESDSDAVAGAVALSAGPTHLGRDLPMTLEERAKMLSDIYGSQPNLVQDRMAALEVEIGRIQPEYRREAVLTALRSHPLLFVSSAHSTLFLSGEDFNPREGALRMARYWEQRERLFGDRAYDPQVFSEPKAEHYLLFYERSLKLASEPDADETMSAIAKEYIKNVHRAKIEALDRLMDAIPPHARPGLTEALERDPDGLVSSDEFKLKFLRAEDFHEHRAAKRMLKYWQLKLELFGEEIVHRKIVWDDLSDQSKEMLDLGSIRFMPGTDGCGRTIFIMTMTRLPDGDLSAKSMAQFAWYLIDNELDSVTLQRNGFVGIVSYNDCTRETIGRFSSVRRLLRRTIVECLPCKTRAIHLYVGTQYSWWHRVLRTVLIVWGRMFHQRMILHIGTGQMLMLELENFGMTPDQVPTELGGKVDFDYWTEWIQEKRSFESSGN